MAGAILFFGTVLLLLGSVFNEAVAYSGEQITDSGLAICEFSALFMSIHEFTNNVTAWRINFRKDMRSYENYKRLLADPKNSNEPALRKITLGIANVLDQSNGSGFKELHAGCVRETKKTISDALTTLAIGSDGKSTFQCQYTELAKDKIQISEKINSCLADGKNSVFDAHMLLLGDFIFRNLRHLDAIDELGKDLLSGNSYKAILGFFENINEQKSGVVSWQIPDQTPNSIKRPLFLPSRPRVSLNLCSYRQAIVDSGLESILRQVGQMFNLVSALDSKIVSMNAEDTFTRRAKNLFRLALNSWGDSGDSIVNAAIFELTEIYDEIYLAKSDYPDKSLEMKRNQAYVSALIENSQKLLDLFSRTIKTLNEKYPVKAKILDKESPFSDSLWNHLTQCTEHVSALRDSVNNFCEYSSKLCAKYEDPLAPNWVLSLLGLDFYYLLEIPMTSQRSFILGLVSRLPITDEFAKRAGEQEVSTVLKEEREFAEYIELRTEMLDQK